MSVNTDSSQISSSSSIDASMDPPQILSSSSSSSPSSAQRIKLEDINWDHSFVRELPGDSREGGPVRQVSYTLINQLCYFVSEKFFLLFPAILVVVRPMPSAHSPRVHQ